MKKQNTLRLIKTILGLSFSSIVFAEPIIVEGVVPNAASKQAILDKMYSVYGADQVVDRIHIKSVSVPLDWNETVTRAITPDLKKVKQGKLTVRGSQVELTGKMMDPSDIQATTVSYQNLVQHPYRFTAQLSVNKAEQKIIDDTLKNRIIEFESGSAVLTAAGRQILDEMAVALNKVSGKKVKIIGHTDSSGDANKNYTLSQQRADAVKNYLIAKNIPETSLSTEGKGASVPVADNATAEGRKKNRRIEFEVL